LQQSEYRSFETLAQNAAMSNEFKGNLFEYMVAHTLARELRLEEQFIAHFSGVAKQQLGHYEAWLRKNNPKLIQKLPALAKSTVAAIKGLLPKNLLNIHVIGKYSPPQLAALYHEGDILLENNLGDYTPLSLKLCKEHGFVNTKSGGVKSFLQKYFTAFEHSEFWQNSLNHQVQVSFQDMLEKLYAVAGLEFTGRFDEQWQGHGLSELPGQLEGPYSVIVQESYREMSKVLYDAFVYLQNNDAVKFSECLLPLMGFGNRDLMQIICYHKDSDPRTIICEQYEEAREAAMTAKILQINQDISSFVIQMKSRALQIRIKPMNKFTVPGFKINCSVKRE